MPGGRGDIDHIAIAPTGVYVIDTKAHKGRVRITGRLLAQPKLLINGCNRTGLLDGLDRQREAVRTMLARDGYAGFPIHSALCFTKADLPFLRTQKMRGHLLTSPRALTKRLNADGGLRPAVLDELADKLAARFPPA